ncbi:MAG TPA: tetratricopeptide repeat protein, partial [Spirochaetota bacterium]|nr:tetratricopeptide repeat protein [Spirochaetota bacterium]
TGFGKAGKSDIDYVMFARETLKRKAGDCDDLTVLYASLLESIGIRTAIVTVPGHVFVMFDTEVPPENSGSIVPDRALLYVRGGTVWIPVEVTMVGKTFVESWRKGAEIVQRHAAGSDLEVVETASAWSAFPPADIGDEISIALPDTNKIETLFEQDAEAFRALCFDEQGRALQSRIKENPNDHGAHNALGILAARQGRLEEAASHFRKALAVKADFVPALANIGNVFMLQRRFQEAADCFRRSIALSPSGHALRIGLARACYELGQRAEARREYEIAVTAVPGYARQYAYLGDTTEGRASDIAERLEKNIWGEDKE